MTGAPEGWLAGPSRGESGSSMVLRGAGALPVSSSRRLRQAERARAQAFWASSSGSPRNALQAPSPSERFEPTPWMSSAAADRRRAAPFRWASFHPRDWPLRPSLRREIWAVSVQGLARSRKRRWSSLAVPVSSSMDSETTSWTASSGVAGASACGIVASVRTMARGRLICPPAVLGAGELAARRSSSPKRESENAHQGPGEPPSRARATMLACSRSKPVRTVALMTGRRRKSFSTVELRLPAMPVPVPTPQSDSTMTVRVDGKEMVLMSHPAGWLLRACR